MTDVSVCPSCVSVWFAWLSLRFGRKLQVCSRFFVLDTKNNRWHTNEKLSIFWGNENLCESECTCANFTFTYMKCEWSVYNNNNNCICVTVKFLIKTAQLHILCPVNLHPPRLCCCSRLCLFLLDCEEHTLTNDNRLYMRPIEVSRKKKKKTWILIWRL